MCFFVGLEWEGERVEPPTPTVRKCESRTRVHPRFTVLWRMLLEGILSAEGIHTVSFCRGNWLLFPQFPYNKGLCVILSTTWSLKTEEKKRDQKADLLSNRLHVGSSSLPVLWRPGERILKVTKKSGNRGRCRKLSLWNWSFIFLFL